MTRVPDELLQKVDPLTLRTMLAHVVVRDYPETLQVFRSHNVDLKCDGGLAVGSLPGAAEGLLAALADAIAWRARSGNAEIRSPRERASTRTGS